MAVGIILTKTISLSLREISCAITRKKTFNISTLISWPFELYYSEMSNFVLRFKNIATVAPPLVSKITKKHIRSFSTAHQHMLLRSVPVAFGVRSLHGTAWTTSADKIQQSEKIQNLTQKILELNSLEVNQLIFSLQV